MKVTNPYVNELIYANIPNKHLNYISKHKNNFFLNTTSTFLLIE